MSDYEDYDDLDSEPFAQLVHHDSDPNVALSHDLFEEAQQLFLVQDFERSWECCAEIINLEELNEIPDKKRLNAVRALLLQLKILRTRATNISQSPQKIESQNDQLLLRQESQGTNENILKAPIIKWPLRHLSSQENNSPLKQQSQQQQQPKKGNELQSEQITDKILSLYVNKISEKDAQDFLEQHILQQATPQQCDTLLNRFCQALIAQNCTERFQQIVRILFRKYFVRQDQQKLEWLLALYEQFMAQREATTIALQVEALTLAECEQHVTLYLLRLALAESDQLTVNLEQTRLKALADGQTAYQRIRQFEQRLKSIFSSNQLFLGLIRYCQARHLLLQHSDFIQGIAQKYPNPFAYTEYRPLDEMSAIHTILYECYMLLSEWQESTLVLFPIKCMTYLSILRLSDISVFCDQTLYSVANSTEQGKAYHRIQLAFDKQSLRAMHQALKNPHLQLHADPIFGSALVVDQLLRSTMLKKMQRGMHHLIYLKSRRILKQYIDLGYDAETYRELSFLRECQVIKFIQQS